MFTDDWDKLTPDQRFAARMGAWQAPQVEFCSEEARQAYTDRVQSLRDAIELKKPARVPVAPWVGLFPMRYAGFTAHDAYYDYAKVALAWDRYHADFRPDVLALTSHLAPAKVFDILDYRMYDWPGHGCGEDSCYLYNDREYMREDEYDLLISDPSNYWQRYYVPRMFGAIEPWSALSPFTDLVEMPFAAPFFVPFAQPSVTEMLRKLVEAGHAAEEWRRSVRTIDARQTSTLGIPSMVGSATKAPYDILGDTLRGTKGIMLDKFRRPALMKEAMRRLVPLAIDWAVRSADARRHPLVFIPSNKGADVFMSDADYREFYWPTFKQLLLGLIDQGLVPFIFAEGCYNGRLEVIDDPELPRGHVVWMFEDTDMARAKKTVGSRQCIGGNVPASLLTLTTPGRVDAYVKDLLATTAAEGGFILSTATVLEEADPACFKAFVDAGLEYGSKV